MNEYWIGKLSDGRIVLFDPKIQEDNQQFVYLFVYRTSTIEPFPKVETRKQIKPVKDKHIIDDAINLYNLFSDQKEKSVELLGIEIGNRMFDPNDEPLYEMFDNYYYFDDDKYYG